MLDVRRLSALAFFLVSVGHGHGHGHAQGQGAISYQCAVDTGSVMREG